MRFPFARRIPWLGATPTPHPHRDPEQSATAEMVEAAYRLFLGRKAESQQVVAEKVGLPLSQLVLTFISSDEFSAIVLRPVLAGEIPERWPVTLADGDAQSLLEALGAEASSIHAGSHWIECVGSWITPLVKQQLKLAVGSELTDAFVRKVGDIQDDMSNAPERAAKTLARLQALADGIVIAAINDLIWKPEEDLFISVSSDPWFTLTPAANVRSVSKIARLSIYPQADIDSSINLYIDAGSGFSEEKRIDYIYRDRTALHFILVDLRGIRQMRLDPRSSSGKTVMGRMELVPIEQLSDLMSLRSSNEFGCDENRMLDEATRHCWDTVHADALVHGEGALEAAKMLTRIVAGEPLEQAISYQTWVSLYHTPTEEDYGRMAATISRLRYAPTFSFIVPVYNTPLNYLKLCMNSMLAQNYPHFEICVVDDNSPSTEVHEYLSDLARSDSRVKFARRTKNGHISEASNTAAALATGDFLVLVDHDDEIPDYALFVVAHYIGLNPNAQVLFSDEDKITGSGMRFQPYFKSNFNEFLMYGHNMVSHLGIYRTDLFRAVGGFRRTFEGSQDYDLFFRCFEKVGIDAVTHIPHVLYHWRAIPGSTAVSADQKSYAFVAAQAAINGHFERTERRFRSIDAFAPGVAAVDFTFFPSTSVSIVIPTRDNLDVLKPCIESILATSDENTEIIVVDNGSRDQDACDFLKMLEDDGHARVISHDAPFNFAEINNLAVQRATGDIICFLNNDIEVVSPRWLSRARALLSQADVGAVGARLIFPDGRLQHFGVVLGLGSHRIAGHPHVGWHENEPGYFTKARLIAEFSAVTGACLFVRKKDFEAVGGFDDQFEVAYNDVDLCLKLRSSGFKVVCDPEIKMIHKESHSRGSDLSGAKAQRLEAEAERMRQKWGVVLQDDPYYSPNLSLNSGDFLYACPPRFPLPISR